MTACSPSITASNSPIFGFPIMKLASGPFCQQGLATLTQRLPILEMERTGLILFSL